SPAPARARPKGGVACASPPAAPPDWNCFWAPAVAHLHLLTTNALNVCGVACLFVGSRCIISGMRGWWDLWLGLIAANAGALLLALIARDHIGMPASMVREDA